jgi:hypothetical protein
VGAVMIFSAALEGDVCVFWSALDDLAAGLSTRQRCRVENCLLGLSGFTISGSWGVMPCHRIRFPYTLGASHGRVCVGDGDELGDSSAPPLAPVCSGMIAHQLLRHGESLGRSQLTPRTSARSRCGDEGERRLCTPGWEVGGLKIFLLGRDMLAMDDGLGVSSNSVAAVKTLKPCVSVSHGEADLENTPQPLPGARQMSVDFVSQEHGVPGEGPKGFECRGLYARDLECNGTLDTPWSSTHD